MKNLILISFLLLSLYNCTAQKKVTGRYVESTLKHSKNNSFICKEIRFVSKNSDDTLKMNVRLPLKVDINNKKDTIGLNIIDNGIYYNCHLQKDTIYTIQLKKICVNEIPDFCNSYYKINAVFENKDCSEFSEINKNTPYEYKCGYSKDYGKFIDIDNTLYEIVDLKPTNNCFYPH